MNQSRSNRNQRGASKAPSDSKEETSLEFGSLLDMELQEWEPQLLERDNIQLEEWEPMDMEPLEEWIEESVKNFNSEQSGNKPN